MLCSRQEQLTTLNPKPSTKHKPRERHTPGSSHERGNTPATTSTVNTHATSLGSPIAAVGRTSQQMGWAFRGPMAVPTLHRLRRAATIPRCCSAVFLLLEAFPCLLNPGLWRTLTLPYPLWTSPRIFPSPLTSPVSQETERHDSMLGSGTTTLRIGDHTNLQEDHHQEP